MSGVVSHIPTRVVRSGSGIFQALAGAKRRGRDYRCGSNGPAEVRTATTPMRYLLPTLWSQASVDLSTLAVPS
jgi:hypothetical protein